MERASARLPAEASPMPRNSWMLPSSDEEDDDDASEQPPLLPAGSLHFSRHRWMRRILAGLEEYFVCVVMPALCLFAVYSLTLDHYASETFFLSTNSSLLLQPSPFLVDAVEVQVVGEKQGPELYGFNAAPQLGSEASWSESHDILVVPDQPEAFSLWLNKGSLLNVTCLVKQPGFHNVIMRVLQEHKSTRAWIEDAKQKAELDCNEAIDGSFQYRVLKDGNYSLVVENLEMHHVEVFLGFEVVATLYNTNSAVYMCIPFPKACQLQISFVGKKAAVLSTPKYSQNNIWKAKLSYKVRWFALAGALGCAFFIASTLLKLASQVHVRRFRTTEEGAEQNEEDGWGDYEEISEGDACADNAFCVVCLDAFKDSFFIPCGHSTTCLPCGQRLKNEEGGVCPICEVPIEMVNQVFHV